MVEAVDIARMGLTTSVEEAGHTALPVTDLERLPCELDVVLIPQRMVDADGIDRLCDVHGGPFVVTLLHDPVPVDYARSLTAGAVSAVSWDATADEVSSVISAAADGRSLLPRTIATSLAQRAASDSDVNDAELSWLRQLARGDTIAEIALASGYSERSMYRLLGALYVQLGAKNRSEAIAAAATRRLL